MDRSGVSRCRAEPLGTNDQDDRSRARPVTPWSKSVAAREPLLDRMDGVARRGLSDEAEEREGELAHQFGECAAARDFSAKAVDRHSVAEIGFALHHRG